MTIMLRAAIGALIAASIGSPPTREGKGIIEMRRSRLT